MKLFIFQGVEKATDNYHDGGSVAVVAADREAVDRIVRDHPPVTLSERDWEQVVTYDLAGQPEERLFVFEDAGCC